MVMVVVVKTKFRKVLSFEGRVDSTVVVEVLY
jgi:hypothetical protein